MPTWSRKRKLISMPPAANFQDNLMLKPKGRSSKTMEKHNVLCIFEYQRMSIKHKDDVTTMSKKHENHCRNHRFLNKKAIIFGLDVGTRNFEVLGRILASILGVLRRSWGRLGASWAPLRASWAPLWLQSTYTNAATQHIKKNMKNQCPKNWGRRHQDAPSGVMVKLQIPRKA